MPAPYTYEAPAFRPSLVDRIGLALSGLRDWLDARGRLAWLAAMILGFVVAWPIGLFLLGYIIWSKRMIGHHGHFRSAACCSARGRGAFRGGAGSGNTAFDAYREETLRRLEEEHEAFVAFLAKLREAKDKAEFDAFMQERRNQPEANG